MVMTRIFDAPRRLIFDAFSKPELLRRWSGPRGLNREIVPPERSVSAP